MGLRMVYGRAGTGKSSFCYQEIQQNQKKKERVYIITPEQFSFTAEKKLMESLSEHAVLSAEVLTFQRMAYRVMQEVGGGTRTQLSSLGRVMLLYDILDQNKKKLNFLGKTDKNVELIHHTITELKKHHISVEQLRETLEEINDPQLQYKMQDILLLYEEFQTKIQNNYIDENDRLTILIEQLDQTEMFKNTNIYFDEFVGFTPQEYGIIEKLLQQAKEVTVTICADKLEGNQKYLTQTDLFYANRMTRNRLVDMADRQHVERKEEIYLEKRYRYQNEELKHIEQYLYQYPYRPYFEKPTHLHLWLASNPYAEMEQVAKTIVILCREKGYRYKDIAIITKNMETYASLTKAIFSTYGIPVFIDQKRDLSENVLVKYILSVLEILSKNWSHETVFNYIKNSFSDIDKKEAFRLENYCLQWGITKTQWYSGDWQYDDQAEGMNELRKKIVKPILELKEKLTRRKTVEQMTKALYEFLEENQIHSKLQRKIHQFEQSGDIELANEYETSWNVVLQVLDELVLILKEEVISFEAYLQTLKIGLGESGLGKIPATLDQVIMGDVDRSRSHKVKVIFMIGLNDGSFPSFHSSEGFLNDDNREQLKQMGLELAKTTKEQLWEENFNIYKAFTTAEEELYLSYASTNQEGAVLRASTLLSKIKKLYPNLQEQSDLTTQEQEIYTKPVTFEALLTKLQTLQEQKELPKQWQYLFSYYAQHPEWKEKLDKAVEGMWYTNLPKPIQREKIQDLYGNILNTSVSRLEQYRSCPFSFYLKYGLGIEEKETLQIKSVDTGSFMHDVIDRFFSVVQEQEWKLANLGEEEIQEVINQIVDEMLALKKNAIFRSRQKYQVLVNRLRRLLVKTMKYILQTITESDFTVAGHEVEFKEGKMYPPIQLQLENGKRVEITGKIDRMDIGKKEDKTYLRIIDYKSSIKNLDLNEVEAGLQIQLLTYLDAVTKEEEVLPGGIFYFPLMDPVLKANKTMTEEEIEQEIKKQFKMQGLVLAEVNVVNMMDKNLTKGSSDLIPVYLDKEGNISQKRSNAISKEQFQVLQQYIYQTIQQIADEILSGKIEMKPYYSDKKKTTPCQYCQYHAICQFDTNLPGNEYQYIPNLDKEIVLEKIKQTLAFENPIKK